MSMLKNQLYQGLVFVVCMALWACSSSTEKPKLRMDTVTIYTDMDANQNSATPVDLVIVYDKEVEKMLSKLTAAKYFASSKQLRMDNPTLLDIWHWELVPGQIVQDFEPPQEQGRAFAAFVFANYLTPGDHRLKVAPSGVVKILLQKNNLVNLASYDVHEMRSGTTTAEEVAKRDEGEESLPPLKVGPVHGKTGKEEEDGPNSCAKGPPECEDKNFHIAPCEPAPNARSAPVSTRQLCPPKQTEKSTVKMCKPYKK